MHAKAVQEPAIVLHARPYRETSLLVQLLTRSHGRVGAVAKAARRGRQGHGMLPFYEQIVSWRSRGSLISLGRWEVVERRWLVGNALAAAYYLAELVMRLTREWEPHQRLFAAVQWALRRLSDAGAGAQMAVTLRRFEQLLLEELGYGLDFTRDAGSGKAIEQAAWYRLEPDQGFLAAEPHQGYLGRALLDIQRNCYADAETRREAKRIFRAALARRLGPAPLLSRQLFRPATPDTAGN